jgi:polysaccharide export outer membrane protein
MRLPPRTPFTALLLFTVAVGLLSGDLFAQAQAQQPPPAAREVVGVALPSNFVIGAEDVIGVVFWREPEMSGDVSVRPDGKITLPLIGDMTASGLTPDSLKAQIQTAAQKYLTDANVTVVVRQLNSRKVFVTGEVAMPGAYPLAGPRTVLQILALAGGLNEYADASKITIMRQAKGTTQALKFNYKDVSKGKNLQQNIALEPGDTVVVP